MTELPPPVASETAAPAASTTWWRRRLQVPVWLVAIVAALVVGSVLFAAGKGDSRSSATARDDKSTVTKVTTADDSSTSEARRTTTTPKATTTTAKKSIGTRDNPLPLGLPVPAGDWTYEVVAFEADVTSMAVSFNQFNDPPLPGQVISRLRVKATYNGQGSGSPYMIDINLVSAAGKTYGPCRCVSGGSGGDPDDLSDQAETFSGGYIEGWLYYAVDAADAAGAMLAFDPNVNYSDVPGGTGFFAVN